MTDQTHVELNFLTTHDEAIARMVDGVTLEVYADTTPRLKGVTRIVGNVRINRGVQLPDLREIDGTLSIHGIAELPNLETVTGELRVYTNTSLPALRTIGGRVYMSGLYATDLPNLEEIGADVCLFETFSAPKLRRVHGHDIAVGEVAEERVRNVAIAALATDDALNMSDWHTCNTTHCIAGWGVHQQGEAGYALEDETDGETAGLIILGLEATRYFYTSTDMARDWLRTKLAPAEA
jgi:hypothetical protein